MTPLFRWCNVTRTVLTEPLQETVITGERAWAGVGGGHRPGWGAAPPNGHAQRTRSSPARLPCPTQPGPWRLGRSWQNPLYLTLLDLRPTGNRSVGTLPTFPSSPRRPLHPTRSAAPRPQGGRASQTPHVRGVSSAPPFPRAEASSAPTQVPTG